MQTQWLRLRQDGTQEIYFRVCGYLNNKVVFVVVQELLLGMMKILSLLTTFMMRLVRCLKAWMVIWKMTQYERSANSCTIQDLSIYYFLHFNAFVNFLLLI